MTIEKKRLFWSKAEDVFIERNARHGVSLKDIASMMQHRSLSSISNRARKLGVGKSHLKQAQRLQDNQDCMFPLIRYAGHPGYTRSQRD